MKLHQLNILTHSGQFHADEVVAVELLKRAIEHSSINIVRTRDNNIIDTCYRQAFIIVDITMEYDHSKFLYDHHQDLSLPSSAGLIWKHYKDAILPDCLAQDFFSEFIAAIDAIDVNRDNIYEQLRALPNGFRNVSSIVSGFNRDPKNDTLQDAQFQKALLLVSEIIGNELLAAEEKASSIRSYDAREVLSNNVAVFQQFSTVWKDKADHNFAIMPHSSGWQLQSRDSSQWVVPESISKIDGFIFRHKSGFMATSSNLNSLLEFAKAL